MPALITFSSRAIVGSRRPIGSHRYARGKRNNPSTEAYSDVQDRFYELYPMTQIPDLTRQCKYEAVPIRFDRIQGQEADSVK